MYNFLKAISVRQPWASLILCGSKLYETRSWSTTYRGPLLLHAGKAHPPDDGSAIALARRKKIDLPRGVVIGVVELADIVTTDELSVGRTESRLGNFSAGRFAWRLKVILRTPPFEATGQLGIFGIREELLLRTSSGRSIVDAYRAAERLR